MFSTLHRESIRKKKAEVLAADSSSRASTRPSAREAKQEKKPLVRPEGSFYHPPSDVLGIRTTYRRAASLVNVDRWDEPLLTLQPVGRDRLEHARFKPLPLAASLGTSLQYGKIDPKGTWDDEDLPENKYLRALSRDFDPTSPNFGRPLATYSGEIILSKTDGRDLDEVEVEALYKYITKKSALKDLLTYGDSETQSRVARQRAVYAVKEGVNDTKFSRFLRQYRDEKKAALKKKGDGAARQVA